MSKDSAADLVVLVADRNMEAAVRGLFSRQEALGIRKVDVHILRHPQKDCGCRNGGVEFLAVFPGQYRHALLMFDREGSGEEGQRPETIESDLEGRLSLSGWAGRAAVIVLDPELETWVWSGSPHVAACLGWTDRTMSLPQWLCDKGYLASGEAKPTRPKEAMEAALWMTHTPRSSAIYQRLAETVSTKGCVDRAFVKFRTTMQRWFS